MLLTILAGLAGLFIPGFMCYFGRRHQQERDERIRELHDQSKRAAAAANGGVPLPAPPAAAAVPPATPPLQRDSLRAPLLDSIPEDAFDAFDEAENPEPVQALEDLPDCVQRFLGKAIRDARPFQQFTLQQLGEMKLDLKGGWKQASATQRACPLEPAFVWTATAHVAPLVTIKGFDSLVNGSGYCAWQLWGAVPAASGGGREVDQSLRVRWLAEAVCFPQALLPSRFLHWEPVKGEDRVAEAVLTYGGVTVRALFSFDCFDRVVRMRSHDLLRRLPSGSYETGEWLVQYSGHMLFGLSPQGPVINEECATRSGVFIPTNMQASWVLADGTTWCYARFSVSKVTAE